MSATRLSVYFSTDYWETIKQVDEPNNQIITVPPNSHLIRNQMYLWGFDTNFKLRYTNIVVYAIWKERR